MKYKIIILFITIVSILSINIIDDSSNELPLLGKVICVDSGHPSYVLEVKK